MKPVASDTKSAPERIESDTKLTPLTDPSVRGVLVDDGQPTRDAIAGKLYQGGVGNVWQATVSCEMQYSHQPLKLRPASEFGVARHPSTEFDNHHNAAKCPYCTDNGKVVMVKADELEKLKAVAARGEPGLKKLPEGAVVLVPSVDCMADKFMWRGQWYQIADPLLYGIPDGGERIKELEAELADWKADTADQLCVNCSDPLEYQERADAEAVKHWSGIVAKKNADAERLRERIKELEARIKWLEDDDLKGMELATHHQELEIDARADAERLRKAIGEQPLYAFVVDFPKKDEPYYMRVHDRWMIAPNDFSNNQWEVYRRWSPPGPAALTPSPTAASGEKPAMESAWLIETHIGGTPVWYTSNNPCRHFTTDACAADKFSGKDEAEKFASDIGLPRDWKATEHGFDSSPVPAADYLNKMADAEDAAGDISIGTSAPAAESQGNAQHHSEGAKILKGGSGSSAAESEGERKAPDPEQLFNEVVAALDQRVKARLAACEERCRELEAGIERHRRDAGTAMPFFTNDTQLWSLLAPKAGGEDGGYDYVTIPTPPEPTK